MQLAASKKQICVVGGGPSALTTLKELIEFGHEAIAFEKQGCLGGVFSALYEQICLTTSGVNVVFSCHYADDVEHPTVWQKEKYIQYLEQFADKYNLHKHIHLSHEIIEIKQDQDTKKWKVTVKDLKKEKDGTVTHVFDHIAMCSGVHSVPNRPTWPGMEKFKGEILHTADYVNADRFTGNKVLIVGLGESGSDICLQVGKVAESSCISSRAGPGYVIPRLFAGLPSDIDTTRCYHSLPRWLFKTKAIKLKQKLESLYIKDEDEMDVFKLIKELNNKTGLCVMNRYGIKNASFAEAMINFGTIYKPNIFRIESDKVIFVDGTEFECDVILCCTGFSHRFPYLEKHHPELTFYAQNPRRLYKHMIIPVQGYDIVWIGFVRPALGSIPPLSEMQARYFALLVSGIKTLPSAKEMLVNIKEEALLDYQQFPIDAKRLLALTDYFRFLNSMSHLIGCEPKLSRLFFTKPRIWAKVMFAPITGAQYRLYGPGKTPEEAQKILKRIPTMPKLIIAYEFFLFCLCKLLSLVGFKSFKLLGGK